MTRTVVILNDFCHVQGGASRIAIDEAVGLAAAGEHVVFLGATGPVAPELKASAVKVVCLEQPELLQAGVHPTVLLQGLWNQRAYNEMKRVLAALNPKTTVIHLHGYTKSLSSSPVRAAVEKGFQVVCTLHDFFAACPNGAFFLYHEVRPCPKIAMSLDCISTNCDKRHYAHKLYRVARQATQRSIGMLPRGIHHYITLSERSATILKPYLPEKSRFYPLENLIDAEKRPPVDVAAQTAIVAVGRLEEEKGIFPLLEAVKQSGIQVTFVGDGPLRVAAEAAGCRVTGWVSAEQVQAELEQARALVFPSLWYETYGLVVGEAAARGVPAIVSDISAASERVVNGETGWQVRAGEVAALAEVLGQARDNATVAKYGEAAYARFWQNPPTRANHIAGLRVIYEQVLNNPTVTEV